MYLSTAAFPCPHSPSSWKRTFFGMLASGSHSGKQGCHRLLSSPAPRGQVPKAAAKEGGIASAQCDTLASAVAGTATQQERESEAAAAHSPEARPSSNLPCQAPAPWSLHRPEWPWGQVFKHRSLSGVFHVKQSHLVSIPSVLVSEPSKGCSPSGPQFPQVMSVFLAC